MGLLEKLNPSPVSISRYHVTESADLYETQNDYDDHGQCGEDTLNSVRPHHRFEATLKSL